MNKRNLGVVYNGSSQHSRTFNEPKYRKHIDDLIYLPDLADHDLTAYRAILVPSRLHRGRLAQAVPGIARYLAEGGTVIALGDQSGDWLPGMRYEWRVTNFWWWLEPEPKSGIEVADPAHSLWHYLSLADATWHQHGVFWAPPEAEVAIRAEDGAAVFYTDTRSAAPGTLVLTTLDPDFHYGSYFMPATERFLDRFFPWLQDTLIARR